MNHSLNIVSTSPCPKCDAACCRQNGHEFAVLLEGDEARRFQPFAQAIALERGAVEWVLPYVDGKCQFLGQDDRCTIYEDRPANCRRFECVGNTAFLERNPRVVALLEG